jgi:hypothetical protein
MFIYADLENKEIEQEEHVCILDLDEAENGRRIVDFYINHVDLGGGTLECQVDFLTTTRFHYRPFNVELLFPIPGQMNYDENTFVFILLCLKTFQQTDSVRDAMSDLYSSILMNGYGLLLMSDGIGLKFEYLIKDKEERESYHFKNVLANKHYAVLLQMAMCMNNMLFLYESEALFLYLANRFDTMNISEFAEPESTLLREFYRNKVVSDELGHIFIDDIVLTWGDDDFIKYPKYIDWLFPIPRKYIRNSTIPLFDTYILKSIQSDREIQKKILILFTKILHLYDIAIRPTGDKKQFEIYRLCTRRKNIPPIVSDTHYPILSQISVCLSNMLFIYQGRALRKFLVMQIRQIGMPSSTENKSVLCFYKGRAPGPNGAYLIDILEDWKLNDFLACHNYEYWLFPLQNQSISDNNLPFFDIDKFRTANLTECRFVFLKVIEIYGLDYPYEGEAIQYSREYKSNPTLFPSIISETHIGILRRCAKFLIAVHNQTYGTAILSFLQRITKDTN